MKIILSAGTHNIAQTIDELSEFTLAQADHYDLPVVSPRRTECKGANTAIVVGGANYAAGALRDMGIIVSPRRAVIRLAHHFFTSEDEIDRAMASTRKLLSER